MKGAKEASGERRKLEPSERGEIARVPEKKRRKDLAVGPDHRARYGTKRPSGEITFHLKVCCRFNAFTDVGVSSFVVLLPPFCPDWPSSGHFDPFWPHSSPFGRLLEAVSAVLSSFRPSPVPSPIHSALLRPFRPFPARSGLLRVPPPPLPFIAVLRQSCSRMLCPPATTPPRQVHRPRIQQTPTQGVARRALTPAPPESSPSRSTTLKTS